MTLELTTISSLRKAIHGWRVKSETIALVPTMGALHAGHMALVEEAKKQAKRVVVSIFVNPLQFGPKEDLSRYPRPIEQDLALLKAAKVDAVWMPSVEEMYPQGFATKICVSGISESLDGAFRPGHFDGVATVVSKLFLQVEPEYAFFGEKDYQQLCVIKRLVNDLDIHIRIVGVPTVREKDGLALSSRNQYLSDAERQLAPKLYEFLQKAVTQIRAGQDIARTLTNTILAIESSGFDKVDYLELRAEDTLAPITSQRELDVGRLLVAAHIGSTRLIDNVKVE